MAEKLPPLMQWQDEKFNTETGMRNGFRLFTISWSSRREDPAPHQLKTTLPIRLKVTAYATREEAQEAADRVLRHWLCKMAEGVSCK